jgi:polyphosphate kinase
MRRVFEERIEREVQIQRAGGEGRIVAKLDALDDDGIIQQLYAAGQAGVRIDLVVRGHCRLRPGLPGYSENIRVRSIVGRFLEHDRVYCFGNGGQPEIFIGSADWRRRNLAERVEAMVPVTDPALRDRLVHVLQVALADNRLAWELGPDGTYVQRTPGPDEPEVDFQATMMAEALNHAHRGGRPWELREG